MDDNIAGILSVNNRTAMKKIRKTFLNLGVKNFNNHGSKF